MDRFIPLSIPNFEGNEKKYVDDAVAQGWVSTGGAYVTQFEKALSDYLHIEDVAACQSGTAAIHLSLIEAGIGIDDVVLVSPLTFIAAVNPIKYQNAIPVFIDCDDSLCIDPNKLRDFCEKKCVYDGAVLKFNGHVVKAVIVVHVFGNMADMESIMEIAERYCLTVIEDATEALGTCYSSGKYTGRFAGTIGHFGSFSFNGNKIITTGGGGAVTANNTTVVKHLRYLSSQAKDDSRFYIHNEVGYNYRMTNVQAALGVAQMEELPGFIRRKQCNYKRYCYEFGNFPFAKIIPFRKGINANHWFYSLAIDRNRIKISMKELIARLEEKGIQTRAVWGLINEQKPFEHEEIYRLEKAPHYADSILNLPCSTQITEEEIKYVSKTVKDLIIKSHKEKG